jgi:hypothetical protein
MKMMFRQGSGGQSDNVICFKILLPVAPLGFRTGFGPNPHWIRIESALDPDGFRTGNDPIPHWKLSNGYFYWGKRQGRREIGM